MKFLMVLILLSYCKIGLCKAQDHINMVEKLFDIIAESDSTNINGLLETIIIADSLMQVNDGEIVDMVKFYSYFIYDQIKQLCNLNYAIYHHNETEKNLIDGYKLQYDNLEKVYYIVCNNSIFTHAIINKGKVTSFYPCLRTSASKRCFQLCCIEILCQFVTGSWIKSRKPWPRYLFTFSQLVIYN